MPRGYAHTHKEYKTVIPERPFFIGDSYSDQEAERSEDLWMAAMHDLLNTLEANAILGGYRISLMPTQPVNSFQVRMDYYLRRALKERDYQILTDIQADVPVFHYDGWLPGQRQMSQPIRHPLDLQLNDDMDTIPQPDVYVPYDEVETEIYLGLSVYDPTISDKESLLVHVEILHPILTKDLREIKWDDRQLPVVHSHRAKR